MSTLPSIEVKQAMEIEETSNGPKHQFLVKKCCTCLDCRHICICKNGNPPLSKDEWETGHIKCRNYQCFINGHTNCTSKNA